MLVITRDNVDRMLKSELSGEVFAYDLSVKNLADLLKPERCSKVTSLIFEKALCIVPQIETLAKLLESNNSITSLNLGDLHLGETATKTVLAGIKANKTRKLTSITFKRHRVKPETLNELIQQLSFNRVVTNYNGPHTKNAEAIEVLENLLELPENFPFFKTQQKLQHVLLFAQCKDKDTLRARLQYLQDNPTADLNKAIIEISPPAQRRGSPA